MSLLDAVRHYLDVHANPSHSLNDHDGALNALAAAAAAEDAPAAPEPADEPESETAPEPELEAPSDEPAEDVTVSA